MTRPVSILRFERAYLVGWAIDFLLVVLTWNGSMAVLESSMVGAAGSMSYLVQIVAVFTAVSVLLPLIIWYFTAPRGSAVAKWIIVILFVLGVLGTLLGLLQGAALLAPIPLISLLALALRGYGVAMLFRPDAQPWFAGAEPYEARREDADLPRRR